MRIALVVFALITSCTPLAQDVRLAAERTSPTSVRLTLHNDSPNPAGYNLCNSTLQRRSGSEWTAVRTDDVCTMELRTLPPGERATHDKTLPANLPAAEYRYVTSVESPLNTPQRPIPSNPF